MHFDENNLVIMKNIQMKNVFCQEPGCVFFINHKNMINIDGLNIQNQHSILKNNGNLLAKSNNTIIIKNGMVNNVKITNV